MEDLIIPVENIYTINYKGTLGETYLELFDCFDLPTSYLVAKSEINPIYYKEYKTRYDKNFWYTKKDTSLSGHFLCERFFIEYRDELISHLQFKPVIKKIAAEFVNLVKNDNSKVVSIHVRRGDYIDLGFACKFEYYKKAIEYMLSQHSCSFILVTDDISWCKENFKDVPDLVYSETGGSYVDLCIQTLCDHNIICTSTFSWWGAWLNNKLGKIVISPKNWQPSYDFKTESNIKGECTKWTFID